jgi:hypothetical protein
MNLSESGAMVEFGRIPRIGEGVTLRIEGRKPLIGRVRWACDGRIGIHFATGSE